MKINVTSVGQNFGFVGFVEALGIKTEVYPTPMAAEKAANVAAIEIIEKHELADSETGDTIIGHPDEDELIYESLTCGQVEGHIRDCHGRRVYAR